MSEADPERMKPGDEAPPDSEASGEDLCRECGGEGEVDGKRCEACRGTGRVEAGVGGG
jgi:DnaJ-class molecular chaperone